MQKCAFWISIPKISTFLFNFLGYSWTYIKTVTGPTGRHEGIPLSQKNVAHLYIRAISEINIFFVSVSETSKNGVRFKKWRGKLFFLQKYKFFVPPWDFSEKIFGQKFFFLLFLTKCF